MWEWDFIGGHELPVDITSGGLLQLLNTMIFLWMNLLEAYQKKYRKLSFMARILRRLNLPNKEGGNFMSIGLPLKELSLIWKGDIKIVIQIMFRRRYLSI